MRNYCQKTGLILMLWITAVMLTGCFMGDKTDAPTAAAPGPGPGPSNNPPTISGNPPPAVMVGDNYSFTPTASDPDAGNTLSFTIQNQPAWANFDTSTGTLSGIAVLGSEGMYPNIQISVSDGSLSASTPQFSIDVTSIALGSATLSWTPPTQNSDGSPLTDLAAYKIYYGTSQNSFPNQIRIDNPGMSSYVVNDLVPNTYFFVSTSINSMGIESDFSNVASKTIN